MTAPHSRPKPLFAVPPQPRTRTSDVLRALAAQTEHAETVSLRRLTERLGDRTFGMLLVLASIFSIIPLVSVIAGLLNLALGLQMAAGRQRAWLPARILDRPLPADSVRAALLAFEPRVRAFERFIRPRWAWSEAPIVDRLIGLIVALLGIIISIPLPFTNFAPALVILLMGVGLMERDGLVQLGAAVLGSAAMVAITMLVLTRAL